MSGDGNVTNTGDHAIQSATITIQKGDWQMLQDTLKQNGIEETDISELKVIVETEKPEGGNLGSRAIDWIGNISKKALQGVSKIGSGVGSALLAAWIKNYYGIK